MTALLTITSLLFTACSVDTQKQMEDRTQRNGRISVPLTATSNTGVNYIIELPYLSLESEFDSLEFNLQNQTEMDVSIQEGLWSLFVGEYALYREADNGDYHYVESELTSTNPQSFRIFPGTTTRAQLNFRAEGEEVFTDGHLELTINIDDGGQSDTSEDTGSDFFIPAGGKCDPCTAPCTTNADQHCDEVFNMRTRLTYTRNPSENDWGACNIHCIQ